MPRRATSGQSARRAIDHDIDNDNDNDNDNEKLD